ncbi:right-handed parallel beta-helix repeat-containing protein [Erythrobacter sp.]|uniref:right-handed parallel beta-helix repeat-containing protein n=1 Tax=Erythrobacter sp. TaxID=1042 RepID=UPI001425E19C|nr:right-handed parallel beta-helix repeat-containing protein [Erythrobacter sp.]QIQ85494.1 MAG: right-handed parallel beta-helix repeat-containing protein [Erythrobacter sp.]
MFDGVDISWSTPAFSTDPATFADRAPNGVLLNGDCLAFRNGTLHDVASAISVYFSRDVIVEDNEVSRFSVDGIQFSGRGIAIRRNLVRDPLGTPDPLHPDCMQGQPPRDEVFGPVTIEGNTCLARTGDTASLPAAWDGAAAFGWQGINIFDGRWKGVDVRCNLVLPSAQHGIALYGVDDAHIAYNTVLARPRDKFAWIAAMRSKDGRPPRRLVIAGNRASAFLNAVHGGPAGPEAMIDFLGANREDPALMEQLSRPVSGVRLEGNVWLFDTDIAQGALRDPRFGIERVDLSRLTQRALAGGARSLLPAACARDRSRQPGA